MLENLTKSDIVTVLGLGLVAAAVSEWLPNTRPLLRSAIQIGADLLTESEAEAETELIHSLVAATMRHIRQDQSGPASEPERREAMQTRIEDFKRQARIRARRWGADPHDRRRRYRRHVPRGSNSRWRQRSGKSGHAISASSTMRSRRWVRKLDAALDDRPAARRRSC
jgi:hypothetical protein